MLEIMESFKDLLQKLQEAHEREVEVLQVKVKELSNKKGCDTKRMEELFTRNQQMKEQQRLLTENIKTLENRLRAGLCDRCTVTQEVAKRRQQEYEASRIQSLQHISLLAGEMTNLRKENLKLKEDIASLRATLEPWSNYRPPVGVCESRSCSEHNNNNSVDVKPKMSPDLLSPGAVALVSPTISRSRDQLADGDVLVKTEADHRVLLHWTNTLTFSPHMSKGVNSKKSGSNLEMSCITIIFLTQEVYKPQPTLASSWKTEHRKSSSSPSGEVRPSRPVIHAPIPCHPKPIKSGTVSLPWPLSEGPNWGPMAAVGANPALQNPSRGPHLSRLSSLIPPISQATTRRQSQKQSTPQPPKEPTVVFTFRRMPENIENETKAREKKESPPSKTQKVSGEELRESSDGPLDLSDRAKTKPNQPGNDDSPIALQCEGDTQRSPDRNVNTAIPVSSPSLISLPSSSSSTPIKQEQELISDHNHEHQVEDQDKKEEANDKTEQTNGKKVPVLTLSLRP
uniref:Retinoblastoma binding protein 8-like n=1 Tax=Poecilia formosa TaxID=48698 RepID=A0A096MHW2_POEFO